MLDYTLQADRNEIQYSARAIEGGACFKQAATISVWLVSGDSHTLETTTGTKYLLMFKVI